MSTLAFEGSLGPALDVVGSSTYPLTEPGFPCLFFSRVKAQIHPITTELMSRCGMIAHYTYWMPQASLKLGLMRPHSDSECTTNKM